MLCAGKRIYVANLSYKTSWQTLKDCMRDVGTVVYANVMRDDSGAPPHNARVSCRQGGAWRWAVCGPAHTPQGCLQQGSTCLARMFLARVAPERS